MEKTSSKDDELLENMQGFNSVLKDVSSSNQKSLGTLHQVSERIEHSDEQMKVLFEQATQSNQAAGSLMVRLEKRVFLSNLALIVLLSLLLLVGVVWLSNQRQTVLPPPVIDPAPQTAIVPSVAPPAFPSVEKNPPVIAPPSLEVSSPIQKEEAVSLVEESPALVAEPLLAPITIEEPELLFYNGEPLSTDEESDEALDSEEVTEEEKIETLNLFDY